MESFSEHFMKKGAEREAPKHREEGRQEGRYELVADMINNGADIEFIVKYSGFSRELIERLHNRHKNANDD